MATIVGATIESWYSRMQKYFVTSCSAISHLKTQQF